MRLALVHPRLDHRGGAENVMCWMARGLLARGHDVIVATRRFSLELWNERDWVGIPLVVLHKRRLDRLKLRAERKRGLGHQLCRAIGPRDVIVAHNAPAPIWAVIAARRMNTRVVWYCEEPTARFFWPDSMPHLAAAAAAPDRPAWVRAMADGVVGRRAMDESGPNFAIDLALERETIPHIDLALGNSAFTAQNVTRAYGISAEPCLLGMPEPAPAEARRGEPYVAWVTSPIEHKNAYGFLEALHLAVHRFGARDLRVRAVGLRGTAFEGRIAELSLSGAVRCEGWLSDAELNALIAGCRLLAYP
ncbi:MAG TPA: glycosyltransferase, partial [Myxococcota bacterium]|nr:glycosyltransferase [Myxococcota bacterium]